MEEHGLGLDRLAVLDADLAHDTGELGLDLVHDLHGLDDAERVAHGDSLADLDEIWRPGVWCSVEDTDNRRRDRTAGCFRCRLGYSCG